MTDGLAFERTVARFGISDVGYIVEVLRGAHSIVEQSRNSLEECALLQEFIDALDECDSIEIVTDEVLVDEN